MTKRVLWTVIFVLVFFSVYMIAPVSAQTRAVHKDRIMCEMESTAGPLTMIVTKRGDKIYVADKFEVIHMEHVTDDNGESAVMLFFQNPEVFPNDRNKVLALAMRPDGKSAMFIFDVRNGFTGAIMTHTGTCFEG